MYSNNCHYYNYYCGYYYIIIKELSAYHGTRATLQCFLELI